MGTVRYDDNNVITMNMKFDDNTQSLTMCDLAYGANERQLVRDFGYYTNEEILRAVLDFKEKFYTIREIASIVGISKSQVQRILNKHYTPHKPQLQNTITPLPQLSTEPLNPYPIASNEILDEYDLLFDDDNPPTYLAAYPDDDYFQENKEETQECQEKSNEEPTMKKNKNLIEGLINK